MLLSWYVGQGMELLEVYTLKMFSRVLRGNDKTRPSWAMLVILAFWPCSLEIYGKAYSSDLSDKMVFNLILICNYCALFRLNGNDF